METIDKLKLLSDASRFDLSCACGTNDRDRRKRGSDGAWLYPASLPGGGHSVLLKTLISNVCVNDCAYCPFRAGRDVPRTTVEPAKMAAAFLEYVRMKKVFGLFLSSGVVGTPDRSMELLNDTAAILRRKLGYRGYIHLKVIPGASDAAVEEALSLASAVSLNVETPGRERFRKLSLKKDFDRDIVRPLRLIGGLTGKGMRFSGVKATTQFIVGASDETDREIMTWTAGLYDRLRFHRVYFSAYQAGQGDGSIPGETAAGARSSDTFVREHRLYQADFLFRKYEFSLNDFLFDGTGNFSLVKDPKQAWADSHPEAYPVPVNSAGKRELLRVPGIGPRTASLLIARRDRSPLRSWDELGVRGGRLDRLKRYAVLS